MTELLRDLRLAARTLLRSRAFTVTAVLSMAIGIFVVASVFAVTNAYLVRSMPFPAAKRLVRVMYAPVGEREPRGLDAIDWSALPDIVEWADRSILTRLQLADADDATDVIGLLVPPGSLEPLGARLADGRDFRPEEFGAGAERVVIAGSAAMRDRVLGDAAPVYLDLRRANSGDPATRYRVIGVLEAGYRPVNAYGRGEIDFILPQTTPGTAYTMRLRPGIPLPTAERRLTEEVRRSATSLPEGWAGVRLVSTQEEYVSSIRSLLIAITAASVIVLLIVAANVSVLVVLRAMRRERELAVRFALGARTRQIAGLLGLEALVVCATGWGLGMIASVVGLAMASPAIEARLGLPVPGGTPTLSVDGVVLLVAAAGATSVTMLLSFVPLALPLARRFHQTLRSGARSGTEGPRVRRSRSLLVALQVAASVVLVFGGALVARTVTNLVRTDLGYDAESLVRARVRFPERPFPDAASISQFQRAFESELRTRTGLAAAIATVVPFFEKGQERIEVEGTGDARASVNAFGPQYPEVTGMSLLAGRAFTPDDNLGSERVAIVSQALARALGAGGSVLGTRIRTGTDMNSGDEPAVWRTIVGVVSDVRETHRDVDYRDVYLPAAQMGGRYASIYARTPGSGLREWHNEVRSIARGINPGVEIAAPVRLSEGAHQELAAPRFLRSVFAGLAALALGLALLGIYGVTAYAVEQRRLEVAVRSALGAPERTIVRLFLTQGARVVAIGTGAGMVGASWLGRLLENQVFGIAPGDSVTLVASAVVVAVGCLVATWLPSRLAARVHPAEVLRTD